MESKRSRVLKCINDEAVFQQLLPITIKKLQHETKLVSTQLSELSLAYSLVIKNLPIPTGLSAESQLPELFPGALYSQESIQNRCVDIVDSVAGKVSTGIRGIVLEKRVLPIAVENVEFNSASNYKALGNFFLSRELLDSSDTIIGEHITHELAHIEMFIVNFFDPIINKTGFMTWAYSPLRRQNRPLIGCFHASHVLFRVLNYLKSIEVDASEVRSKLSETLDSLETKYFTGLGLDLLNLYRTAV